ncbi:DUF1553 domain-containing protein, partial [Pirellulales bacterium]|nr:DUF1553 domain-containing protein [Pirellulales bacterium]
IMLDGRGMADNDNADNTRGGAVRRTNSSMTGIQLSTTALLTLTFLVTNGARSAAGDDLDFSDLDFSRDIRPILAEHCLLCHGPDGEKRQGDLRLDVPDGVFQDRGGYRVIDRNQHSKSELLRRIRSNDDDLRMPPPDAPSQPTADEVGLLEQWIEEGAEWNAHWSLAPPHRAELPQVAAADWQRNEIDAFVQARLEREGLAPAAEADRFTLLRRASFALTGLPPTPTEVDAFLADRAPGAFERVVDRLLESPGYGEHMAQGWLDAARYADSSGYQADWERHMWPWRDWVVEAMNDNMPFDQFTIEQLAGDMLPDATASQRLATGFNRNHRINDEGGSLDAEFEVEYVVDRVDTTATVWLGLTAGCARCHDHKYDPLSQREFYQLYAIFNNVPEKGIDGREGGAMPWIEAPNPWAQRQMEQLQSELARFQENHPNDVEGVKLLENQIKQIQKRVVVPVMVMQEQPEREPAYLLKRGAYDQPDKSEEIPPAIPAVFLDASAENPTDRLGLARWLVGRRNPLTARVIVNRAWQHHFGVGLVKTSEDFGARGDPPSHPELLDWLATELVRLGWDMKAMHRLIVTSATFRQSSRIGANGLERDPDNRLLARGPRLRLSGAEIRDQALAISGLLDMTIGGPAVKPYQPEGLWRELSFGTGKTTIDFYVQDHGASLYRRTLYTFWKRTVAPPRMSVFDGGSRAMCRVRSDRTNTPMQALTLQNDVTFVESARHLAERMIGEATPERPDAGLEFGWRLAMTRPPDRDELQVLGAALEGYRGNFQADPDAAARLLGNGESDRNTGLDPVAHAAWTMAALSLLNLDETITRE